MGSVLIVLVAIIVVLFMYVNWQSSKNFEKLKKISQTYVDKYVSEMPLYRYRVSLLVTSLLGILRNQYSDLNKISNSDVHDLFLFFLSEYLKLFSSSKAVPEDTLEEFRKFSWSLSDLHRVKLPNPYFKHSEIFEEHLLPIFWLYLSYTSFFSNQDDIDSFIEEHLNSDNPNLIENLQILLFLKQMIEELNNKKDAFLFLLNFLSFHFARIFYLDELISEARDRKFSKIFQKLIGSGRILIPDNDALRDEEFLKELIEQHLGVSLSEYELRLVVLLRFLADMAEMSSNVLENLPDFYLDNMKRTKELLSQFLESSFNRELVKPILIEENVTSLRSVEEVDKALSEIQKYYIHFVTYKLTLTYKQNPKYRDYVSNFLYYLRDLMKVVEFNLKKILLESGEELLFRPMDTVKNGRDFENYCANIFTLLGYKVKLTPATGDQGADLILIDPDTNEKIVVQCKYYSGTVGNKAIQEVIAAKEFYKADKAVVVTNSEFTKSAIELANRAGVELIDGRNLRKILSKIGSNMEEEV